MKRIYRLEATFEIYDDDHSRVIDDGRRLYSKSGGRFRLEADGTERRLSAEEAIQSVEDALVESMHPSSDLAGNVVGLTEVMCHTEEGLDTENSEAVDSSVFVCRWPNGEFSLASAPNKALAAVILDEWAGAHPSQLRRLTGFAADFRLTDEGEIVLNQFNEVADAEIWQYCYPELEAFLTSKDVIACEGERGEELKKRVLGVVNHERTRLREDPPQDEARTELGKALERNLGTSSAVADYYVDQAAKRVLRRKDKTEGKPN